jgi:hypothetical protein
MPAAVVDYRFVSIFGGVTTAASRHGVLPSGSRSRESLSQFSETMPVIFQTATLTLSALILLQTLVLWLHSVQPCAVVLLSSFAQSKPVVLTQCFELVASNEWHPCHDSRRASPYALPDGSRPEARALEERRL